MKRIYLDYAATTPVDSRVRSAMEPYWTKKFGNPSSIHSFGQEAQESIEIARTSVARLLGSDPSEIIFTSGGTEADNSAIQGICRAMTGRGSHIITTSIEHHAVLHCCDFLAGQGFQVTWIPVDKDGMVDPEEIKKTITKKTILISIMHANNEIGTIQPIHEIGTIAKEYDVIFHTDAVQTFGHLPIDVERMGIDLLSISAHKCYGPKGVGALYMRKGTPFIPLIYGGGQEQGKRSSTHNVPGIVGLGRAAEIAGEEMEAEKTRLTLIRNRLLDQINRRIDDVILNGHPVLRLPNNLNLSIQNIEGETLVMSLDLEGIAVSSGSACSSGSTEPSHVLKALGLSTASTRGSLRITIGRFTSEDDIDSVAETLERVVSRLRSLSSFSEAT